MRVFGLVRSGCHGDGEQQKRTFDLVGGRNHIRVLSEYLKDVLMNWVMTGRGKVPEHLQSTADVPWSKVPSPQTLT